MRKLFIGLFCVVALLSLSAPSANASTPSSTAAEIKRLEALLAELTTLLSAQTSSISSTVISTSVKPNLQVTEVSVDKEELSGNSLGLPLPDQTITVRVRNTEVGYVNTSNKKFTYEVVVYEERSGTDKKTTIKSTGEILIPAGGSSEVFTVEVEGGSSFNEDFERNYYPVVRIDTKNKIKETNEKDNTMKSTGTVWTMDYYKG